MREWVCVNGDLAKQVSKFQVNFHYGPLNGHKSDNKHYMIP